MSERLAGDSWDLMQRAAELTTAMASETATDTDILEAIKERAKIRAELWQRDYEIEQSRREQDDGE